MRFLRWFLYLLLALVVILGVYLFFLVGRSFPQEEGEITLVGLESRVEVIRDIDGVPHIYADNTHDLYFAQGYAMAQDRFWQMDVWRHIGAGRLSEMFGSGQVETDMFLRALGLTALAEEELRNMGAETRDVLQAYADGVNAYLAEHDGSAVSLEYGILALTNSGYAIEPWEPIHTLTWAKMMSWDLSSNMQAEIARTALSAVLPIERVEQLYPSYPPDHPVIVPVDQVTAGQGVTRPLLVEALPALESAGRAARGVWDLTGGGFEGIGSNNWVIGGSLTSSGAPILANDPHLGIQMPSIWYEVGLHCVGPEPDCVQDVVGFTFAGAPGVVVGHNERIAWGVTTQAVDTQDLYIEKVNPDNPDQYEVEGQWVDMEIRTETISVAGDDNVTHEVRSTRHGPVISGIYVENDLEGGVVELPSNYVVSMAWQSLRPSTLFDAILLLNRANDYDDFREATSLWDIAAQNIVYADADGNIAYQSTGEVPVRARGDGRYPVPGWTSEYEWTGLVPFEDMPYLHNPPRDWIETANQRVTAEGIGPFEGWDGAPGYRGFRIEEMIQAETSHTIEGVSRMQMDSWDGGAAALVPALLRIGSDSAAVAEIQALLNSWSGMSEPYQATGSSPGAAAYAATWNQVLALTFRDELPEDYWPEGGGRWFQVVDRLLKNPTDEWWDDVRTEAVETRDDVLEAAMAAAHDELTDLLGGDTTKWTWGRIHLGRFENQTLGQSGIAPIEWLFNRTAPKRIGGGEAIVNAAGWDATLSYDVDWIPSFRMVIDLSDLSASTSIHSTGQSGHAFHRHYDDMLERWTDGGRHSMRWDRDQVEAAAENTLILLPG